MKRKGIKVCSLLLGALMVMSGCESKEERAGKGLVEEARAAIERQDYEGALLLLDSLHRSYPEAVQARQEALVLTEQAKLSRSQRDSAYLAPRLEALRPAVDSLERFFETERNAELDHQTKRFRGFNPSSTPAQPYLDYYFNNEGQPEMVVATAGAKGLRSHSVRIENKATGNYVLSDTLHYDGGTNYRFEDGGIKYERLTFTDDNAERLAAFIAGSSQADEVEVTISGEGGTRRFTLTRKAKEAIRSTYDLYKAQQEIKEIELKLENHGKRLRGEKVRPRPQKRTAAEM